MLMPADAPRGARGFFQQTTPPPPPFGVEPLRCAAGRFGLLGDLESRAAGQRQSELSP